MQVTRRSYLRFIYFAVFLVLVYILWHRHTSKGRQEYQVATNIISSALLDNGRFLPDKVAPICRAHGFTPYHDDVHSTNRRTRRVYDLVLFSTELDWLEIRLRTLSPHVDYFIVVESSTTFTGLPRPLILHDNWDRIAATGLADKIIYYEVHDHLQSTWVWDHEDFFRDTPLRDVIPSLEGSEAALQDGDVLLVGDMDEILRPETVALLRHCDFPPRLSLHSQFFYYSFQWRHRGPEWNHPDATTYRHDATLTPTQLRQGLLAPGWPLFNNLQRWRQQATLSNAGWHCSTCLATVAEVREKLRGFSHTTLNTPENRNATVMAQRIHNGEDIFGRTQEKYDRVEGNRDLPALILEEFERTGRFRYLLDRDGEDAAFEDFAEVVAVDAVDDVADQ